jgi:hypothetical protein
VHAKFVVGGGGGATSTFALKTAVGTQNYQSLSLARTGVGTLRLTLATGARAIAIVDVHPVNVANPATAAKYCHIRQAAAVVESTGVIDFVTLTNAGLFAPTEMPFANTDEVHVLLYVDR